MDQVSEVLQTVLKLRELVGIENLIEMDLGNDMVAEEGMRIEVIDMATDEVVEIVMNLMVIEIGVIVIEEDLGRELLLDDELVAEIGMALDEIDLEARLLDIDEILEMIEGVHQVLENLMVGGEIPEIGDQGLGVHTGDDKVIIE